MGEREGERGKGEVVVGWMEGERGWRNGNFAANRDVLVNLGER